MKTILAALAFALATQFTYAQLTTQDTWATKNKYLNVNLLHE